MIGFARTLGASVALAGALAGILASGVGCGGAVVKKERPPAPVAVADAKSENVPITFDTIGSVVPFATVAVQPRVSGPITNIAFKEGQLVDKGALLFEIDSAPYAAALAQAEAVLARDNAQAETADAEAARYTQLIAQKLVSSSDADAKIVAAKALHATVASDKAAVDTARLNLAWTRVTSPISGRADKRQVDLGNLVQIGAAATTVVVIRQISPIQVQFALPQERLLDVQQRVAAAAAGAPAVTVTATIPEHSDVSETGALSFLGGAVDPQSGTISCKADFANKEQHLWPGAYVQVRVTLGTAADAVVVPSAAIQTSQQGPFAFVVNDDLTVAMRPVVAGPAQDGMSVIASGIKAGDKVVVDGQLALVPGAKVAIKPPVAAPKDGAR